MNSIQEKFKNKAFSKTLFKEIAREVTANGIITGNALKHGRKTKWSQPIPMWLGVSVAVAEGNPDKAEPGDYYAYVNIDYQRSGLHAWLPKTHITGYDPKAELKARLRPSDDSAFFFGTNQDDSEKNIVARIRRVYKALPEGEAKAEIKRAFDEERVKLL